MEIAGLRVQLQLILGGDVGVVFVLAGGSQVDLAVLLGLFVGDVGKVAGDGVVRLSRLSDQVQGHHGELAGGAPLEEKHPVVVRHVEQPDKIGLGVLKNLIIDFRSVTHLHDGHTRPLIVGDLRPGTGEHFQRQHGRARGKIVDAFITHESYSSLNILILLLIF